jgi:hypothetical protein
MDQAIEIANINAKLFRKEITQAQATVLIFAIRARYEAILSTNK